MLSSASRRLWWLTAAVVALVLAHGIVWLHAVRQLSHALEDQAGALRAYGLRVTPGPVRWGGWPGRAVVALGPASMEADGFAWRASEVAAGTALFRSAPVALQIKGGRIRFGSAEVAVDARGVLVEAAPGGAVITAAELGVSGAFEAEGVQATLAPGAVTAAVGRVRLSGHRGAVGPMVDTLTLHAATTAPFRPADNLETVLRTWRNAGSAVDLSATARMAGPAEAVGRATLRLDGALQPKLDGTVHITGYAAGLNGFVAAGLLRSRTATAAGAVLGLLAAPSPDGGADVSVQIADGALIVAQFPLLRVPVLEWPGSPDKS